MRLIFIMLMLMVPSWAFAQTYQCMPVKFCKLPGGECENPPDGERLAILEFTETTITFSELENYSDTIEVLKFIGDDEKKSYFGLIESDHVMFTVLENDSIFILGAITGHSAEAMMAELSCERLSADDDEGHITPEQE